MVGIIEQIHIYIILNLHVIITSPAPSIIVWIELNAYHLVINLMDLWVGSHQMTSKYKVIYRYDLGLICTTSNTNTKSNHK